MPGENTLPVQYYHDDFQILSYQFDASAASIGDPTPLLYADRSLIVDSIVVGVIAASASGTDALTFRVSTNCGSTSATSFAVVDTYTNVSAGDTITLTSDSVLRYDSAGAAVTSANSSIAINAVTTGVQSNTIPQGSWLVLDPGTITSLKCTVQIRFRSRPK